MDLLKAFSSMLDVYSNVCLRLVGGCSKEYLSEIMTYCIERKLDQHVHILGMLNHQQIVKEMKKSAFMVHPSWADSCPNTVYESLIAGLPVIASNVGGLPYMIEDGVTGYLVRSKDPARLAATMIRLYADPDLQVRLSRAAMYKMRRRFNRGNIIDAILSVFDKMLTSQKSKP